MGSRIIKKVIPGGDEVITWTAQALSSNGRWTVDYSEAGFVEILSVVPVAISDDAGISNVCWANLSAEPTLTGATGRVLRGTSLTLAGLGPTVRIAPDGTPVKVTVTGR